MQPYSFSINNNCTYEDFLTSFVIFLLRAAYLLSSLSLPPLSLCLFCFCLFSLCVCVFSRALYDKRISAEVTGESLGDEFKGYIFRISGGNDKQGFAMKQGVLTNQRVSLLFRPGMSCYRQRKRGERKRKSIRGCIVSSDLSVINLVVIKKGETEIEGLTDAQKPRRLGPKRASKIRKLFNLEKKDDVRKYVIRRTITKDGKKPQTKAPKIQRLVS